MDTGEVVSKGVTEYVPAGTVFGIVNCANAPVDGPTKV